MRDLPCCEKVDSRVWMMYFVDNATHQGRAAMNDRRTVEHEDKPHLEALFKPWGIEKLEVVTHYTRSAIYQWKPSRVGVPVEAALRVCELAQSEGFFVEKLCPGMPWYLVYGGRNRRKSYEGLGDTTQLEAIVKAVGVSAIARTVGRSRQNIYDAMTAEKCPVWLAFAIEQTSEQRYLVEDFRPELPWWPLYNRRELVEPVKLGVSKRGKL